MEHINTLKATISAIFAALTALWLSRPREHPLLKPYRPPALFRVPPRRRPRR